MVPYTRIAELGRGGMAVVYLVAMRGAHGVTKLAVVKELHAELASDPEFRAMFLDEARLAARLNHPNVVQTYDVLDNARGGCSIVMEYLEGQQFSKLRRWLTSSEDRLATHLGILIEVLAGLEYAHTLQDYDGKALGIVHRDVSPHNVFVTYTGDVKVVDFGIAKATTSSADTRVGIIKGKLSYMPPEQARGEPVDARTDVFALGVMLWEAAAGQRLWRGLEDVAIVRRLTEGKIPRARSVKRTVAEPLDAIIARALARDPADRYPSAAALQNELEAFVATLGRPPLTRRELGAVLANEFIEERAAVRREIETRLHEINPDASGARSQLAPIVQLARTDTAIESARSLVPQPPPSATRPTWRTPLLAAAGVVLLAGGGWLGISMRTPAVTPPPASTEAPPPSPPTPKKVRLELHVTPADASLSLDGKSIANGTSELTDVEGAERRLRVSAPGYVTREVKLSFLIPSSVEITLEKVSAPPRPVAVPPRPVVVPRTSSTPAASVSQKRPAPSNEIDLGY
jgi:serine/threonine-protein kinase